ncbi:MAG TPA: GNAT family N-acetyltransferase [Thermomicrobiales bacterium]|nr:GNAT family N-acetyltransferase [Thermomicrobiales bacterium]
MCQLLTYPHDQVPPELNWQAVSFMRVEWPFINGGMFRETYPAELRPVHFFVVQDDLLLSYAATFRQPVEHAEVTYEMACLGNVFTYPGARRKGYGRRVVEAATRHIRASDSDIATLFCDPHLARFYAANGWKATPESRTYLQGSMRSDGGEQEGVDARRMMLFLSSKGLAGQHAFRTLPMQVPFPW